MAAITPSPLGSPVTYQNAAGGGDTIAPGYRLHVRNGGVAPITVTISGVAPCSHGVVHDVTFTVANGSDKLITPPDTARFANATDGLIHIAYSGVTSVTVGAVG